MPRDVWCTKYHIRLDRMGLAALKIAGDFDDRLAYEPLSVL